MRSLLTTLLIAVILIGLAIGSVGADAQDNAGLQQSSGQMPYHAYYSRFLK